MKKRACFLFLILLLCPMKILADDSIQIIDQDFKVLEVNDYYVKYAWKVTLHNYGDETRKVKVRFDLLDEEDFVLDTDLETGVVPYKEDRTISGNGLIKRNFAKEIGNYRISVSAY